MIPYNFVRTKTLVTNCAFWGLYLIEKLLFWKVKLLFVIADDFILQNYSPTCCGIRIGYITWIRCCSCQLCTIRKSAMKSLYRFRSKKFASIPRWWWILIRKVITTDNDRCHPMLNSWIKHHMADLEFSQISILFVAIE